MSDTTLAARAVACKGWHPVPGLLLSCGQSAKLRLVRLDAAGWVAASLLTEPEITTLERSLRGCLPYLADPATYKLLPILATEAWAKYWNKRDGETDGRGLVPVVTVSRVNGGWGWLLQSVDEFGQVGTVSIGNIVPTEAEAGVAALEAAP